MMKRAGLSQVEKMLVISRVDMEDKANIFKNFRIHMKNILGKSFKTEKNPDAITIEPAFLAQHEEVLAAHGYYRNRSYTDPKHLSQKSGMMHGKSLDSLGRPLNPKGKDGKRLLCNGCGSYRHFLMNCPDSHENNAQPDYNEVYTAQEVSEEEIQDALVAHYLQS